MDTLLLVALYIVNLVGAYCNYELGHYKNAMYSTYILGAMSVVIAMKLGGTL